MWPSAKLAPSRTSSTWASAAGCATVRAGGAVAQQRPAVQLDDARHRGRLGCEVGVRELHERVHGHLGEHRVEAPLEAERGGRLGRHAAAAERAGDVAGEELDAVVEPAQPLVQRAVERRRALVARDREVGPPAVADEQRVAGQDEPRLVAARAVGDDDAAVLRAVARACGRRRARCCRPRCDRRRAAAGARRRRSRSRGSRSSSRAAGPGSPWPET